MNRGDMLKDPIASELSQERIGHEIHRIGETPLAQPHPKRL